MMIQNESKHGYIQGPPKPSWWDEWSDILVLGVIVVACFVALYVLAKYDPDDAIWALFGMAMGR